MMETGYVFLKLEPGKKKESLYMLKSIEGVVEANLVIGLFDSIVKVQGQTIEELQNLYFNTIDKIPGISESRLLIVACERSRK